MHFEARERFRVPPEQLWPLVSDTHRMNKAMGLPVMQFTPEPLETGGARIVGQHPLGSTLLAFLGQVLPISPRRVTDRKLLRWLPGFPIARWVEHPFEFEAPKRYSVLREYFWTPLGLFPFRTVRATVELIPTGDGGTEVVSAADVEPLNPQGRLMARLVVGPKSCARVIEQCRNFERFLLGQASHPFPGLTANERGSAPLPSTNGQTAAPAEVAAQPAVVEPKHEQADVWGRLIRAGVRPELVQQLKTHLESAPEDEVLKMRAFELADRWGVDRRETLVACLRATTAGLLEMSWDVLCPGCRLASKSAGSLGDVPG
jgi:hypothetical protein